MKKDTSRLTHLAPPNAPSATRATKPLIRVQDLHYQVEGKVILQGVELQLEAGEVVAIMGPSGCGKTTLLKCIAGLIRPTRGAVWLGDIEFSRLSEHEKMPLRRRVGIVFQYAALFDYLTVYENVAFGLQRQRRLSRQELDRIVRERLAWVGLEGTEHLYPSQLSGGMRKRVGLARALATNPEVVLFDEPSSGLDPITALQIDSLITHLNKELNLTAIIVSHDVVSVLRVADHLYMLADGQVIAKGTPKEIKEHPHPQVQAFLKAANL